MSVEKAAKNTVRKDGVVEERPSALDLHAAPPVPIDTRDITIEEIEPMVNIRPAHHGVESLAESMHLEGQLQACVVRPTPKGAKHRKPYELVFGYRRYLAAQSLGWKQIRCEVREVADERKRRQLIVENMQRAPLSDVEEARAFYELKFSEDPPLSNAEVARFVGCDPSQISHRLKMLIGLSPPRPDDAPPYPHEVAQAKAEAKKRGEEVPEGLSDMPLALPGDHKMKEEEDGEKTLDILSLVDEGKISGSAAEVIASLPKRQDREQLAKLTMRYQWGEKKVSDWAREAKKGSLIKASEREDMGPVEMLQIEDVVELPRFCLREISDADVERIVLYSQLRNGMDREMRDYIEEEMGYGYNSLWDYIRTLNDRDVQILKRRLAIRYVTAAHRYKDLEPSLIDDLGAPDGMGDEVELRLAEKTTLELPGDKNFELDVEN